MSNGTFNGKPVFSVSLLDFNTFAMAKAMNSRLLSKNIINDEVRDYYKAHGSGTFVVEYNGVFIEV